MMSGMYVSAGDASRWRNALQCCLLLYGAGLWLVGTIRGGKL
jgi:hypothetical protein